MLSAPIFELEEYFAAHQATCSVNIGSSGCKEFTVEEILKVCDLDTQSLRNIPLSDSDPSGSIALRSAIAKQYPKATPNEILVTHGSSEALYLIMASLLKAGDHVISLTPSYQSLIDLPQLIGADVVKIKLNFDDGYTFPLNEILEKISRRTRMVVINSPHNPTGMVIGAKQMDLLVKETEARGVWLLCDEAFADIVHDGSRLPSGRSLGEHCVSVGTLSKSFGLTGLRVGWCYAQKPLITAMRNLKNYTTINLCPLAEFIATAAMRFRDRVLAQQKAITDEALHELTSWIQGRLEWVPPRGGVCCYPRLPTGIDSEVFCRTLAEKYGVFLVPGTVFGDPRHVRLGFGYGVGHLRAGISAIEGMLSNED